MSEDACAFEAYRAEAVVDKFGRRIDSLCVWNDELLCGLQDGSLLFFKADDGAVKSSTNRHRSPVKWQVVRVQRMFGKKSIKQLQIIPARSLLLSLTDEGVNLHTLPELLLKCQALRSKGGTCFAYDDEQSILAVAVKRKIILFQLSGLEFVETSELSLTDYTFRMLWSAGSLFVALKRWYLLVQPKTNSQNELLPTGKAMQPTLALDPSSSEILASQDNCTLFINSNGKFSRKAQLSWGGPPVEILVGPLYVVVALQDRLEIQSIRRTATLKVLQMLPISGVKIVAREYGADGSLFIASMSGTECAIHRLVPVPLDEQARCLAAMNDFHEALELCFLLPDSQSQLQRDLENSLRVQYGSALFASEDFDEGMAQFSMGTDASPLLLLHFFPSLVPKKFRQHMPEKAYGVSLPAVPNLEENTYKIAVSTLLPYLLGHRSRVLASLQGCRERSFGGHDSIDDDGLGQPSSWFEGKEKQPSDDASAAALSQETLASIVDTAVLKAMLELRDTGSVLRLIQQSNFVDVEEGVSVLTARGRYAELAALYQHNQMHSEGLSILRQLALNPDSFAVEPSGVAVELTGLPGVWAAVRYLVSMGSQDLEIIKEHAAWVLAGDPEAGLEAFVRMQPPLPPYVVLQVLSSTSPHFCARYLETALEMGIASPKEFHSELLLIYLQMALQEERKEDHNESAPSSSLPSSTRRRGNMLLGQANCTIFAHGVFRRHHIT